MPIVYHTEPIDEDIRDRIEDMIHDLGQDYFQQAYAPLYHKIESDSKKQLYLGCTTFTRLSLMLVLVNLKARFVWSHKSFIELLVLLKKMLPEENTLPKKKYIYEIVSHTKCQHQIRRTFIPNRIICQQMQHKQNKKLYNPVNQM